jgi:hypothetical protein
MKYLFAGLVAAVSLVASGMPSSPSTLTAAAATQTFTGTIIDDMCANTGHAAMRMGPTDAECTAACVSAHGAAYVLQDGMTIYKLSDQQAPVKFAGRKAKVVRTLDAKPGTIAVTTTAAAD